MNKILFVQPRWGSVGSDFLGVFYMKENSHDKFGYTRS